MDKNEAFRETVLKGLKISILNGLKINISKSSIFNPNTFCTQKPFRKSIFPQKLYFDPKALFLPNNPFRTSIFPKSPIFDPNALLCPNPLQNINIPHFRPKGLEFYPKIPSGHQSSLQAPFLTLTPPFFTKKSLQDINFLLGNPSSLKHLPSTHGHLGNSFSLKAAFLPPRARYLPKMMVCILLRVSHRLPHMGPHGVYPRFYNYPLGTVLTETNLTKILWSFIKINLLTTIKVLFWTWFS